MTPEATKVSRYYKAIAGLIGPAVTLLVIAWFVVTPHTITGDELTAIGAAAFGGGLAVNRAPANKPRERA